MRDLAADLGHCYLAKGSECVCYSLRARGLSGGYWTPVEPL